jgi:hypothetical protein
MTHNLWVVKYISFGFDPTESQSDLFPVCHVTTICGEHLIDQFANLWPRQNRASEGIALDGLVDETPVLLKGPSDGEIVRSQMGRHDRQVICDWSC